MLKKYLSLLILFTFIFISWNSLQVAQSGTIVGATEESLIEASAKGHVERVNQLIKKGEDVNTKYEGGITSLMEASIYGQTEVAKVLLEKGADVTIRNKDDKTAFIFAAAYGNTEIVKLYLNKNVNTEEKDGDTALLWASLYGHTDIVKILVRNGLGKSVKVGSKALELASEKGYTDIVNYLLNMHKNLIVNDEDGETALLKSCENGYADIAKLLIDNGANVNVQSKQGATALISASRNGHIEIVKLLLDNGVDVNAKNMNGYTALSESMERNHPEIVKLLIEHGADQSGKFMGDQTVLTWAAGRGYAEIVKLLLEKGVDVNAKNSALLLASTLGQVHIVELLLIKGANINSKDQGGSTALSLASLSGHIKTVKLLLEKGADINIKDNEGMTPLISASANCYPKIVKLLIDRGAEVNVKEEHGLTALIVSTLYEPTTLKIYLTNMAKLEEYKDADLELSPEEGHINIMKQLLDNGADVNAKDNFGTTALSLAAESGHPETVKLLLEKGAGVNEFGWGCVSLIKVYFKYRALKGIKKQKKVQNEREVNQEYEKVLRVPNLYRTISLIRFANNNMGIISRQNIVSIGLNWSDFSQNLINNGWAVLKNTSEVYLTINPDLNKARIAEVFSNDFADVFSILHQANIERSLGKKALETIGELLAIEKKGNLAQFIEYRNMAVGIISRSQTKSEYSGDQILDTTSGREELMDGGSNFVIRIGSESTDYEVICFYERRIWGDHQYGVLRVGNKYYIRENDSFINPNILRKGQMEHDDW